MHEEGRDPEAWRVSLDDVLDGLVAELGSVVALLKTELRHERRDLDGRAAA